MESLFLNVLTATFHGSIVILAVMLLRVLLKKAPRKFFCFLWLLAGVRLLMPFEIQSTLSLQPMPEVTQVQQVSAPVEVFPEAERQEAPIVQPRLAVPQSDPSPVSPAPAAKSTFNWKAVIP